MAYWTPDVREPWVSANRWLTDDELYINSWCVWCALHRAGWSKNAVAALLGNTQLESTTNPGIWGNNRRAYGICQWNPSTKYSDWVSRNTSYEVSSMPGNLAYLLYDVPTNQQWHNTSEMSFSEFTQSYNSPTVLARIFMQYYEQPGSDTSKERGRYAENWYWEFYDKPIDPKPVPGKKKSNFIPIAYAVRLIR